jgi:transcriptional regulator with XRE-family HTH domain
MKSQTELIQSEKVERLEAVRVKMGINQSQFAKIIGIHTATYSDIKCGRSGISKNVLWHLENTVGINMNWLEHGTGEMYPATGSTIGEEPVPEIKKLKEIPFAEKLLAFLERKENQHIETQAQHHAEKRELISNNHELMLANKELLEANRELLAANRELLAVIADKVNQEIVAKEKSKK